MGYKQAEILKGYIEQLQNEAFEEGVKVATKALSKQMSAIENGQIKVGYWDKSGLSRCSVCGKDEPFVMTDWRTVQMGTPYCPWCGAKMKEEEKDEQ
jgi:hypothetical protein